MAILRPRVSRSEAVSSRISDLKLVSRPSTLVGSGDEYVLILREAVFPDPCPFDGLPCLGVLNLCFNVGLDSVDRPVVFEYCRRYVAFMWGSGSDSRV